MNASKVLIFYLSIFLILSCNSIFAPNSHGNSFGEPHPNPIGNYELIDATSNTEWKYYRITDDSLFYIPIMIGDPEDNLNWDIAFQRYHMRTNSGASGNGNGGAYVDSVETWNGSVFNDLSTLNSTLIYETDRTINTFYNITDHSFSEGISNPALETWARIDTTNNYTMTFSNNKFIVRSSDGQSFYKIWPYDYYDENITSGYISLVYSLVCRLDACGVCGGENTQSSDCNDN